MHQVHKIEKFFELSLLAQGQVMFETSHWVCQFHKIIVKMFFLRLEDAQIAKAELEKWQ